MRQFTMLERGHYKFWTIEVIADGVAVRCTWGRVGTTGQSKDFLFPFPSAANVFVHMKIREKLDKGYKEV